MEGATVTAALEDGGDGDGFHPAQVMKFKCTWLLH